MKRVCTVLYIPWHVQHYIYSGTYYTLCTISNVLIFSNIISPPSHSFWFSRINSIAFLFYLIWKQRQWTFWARCLPIGSWFLRYSLEIPHAQNREIHPHQHLYLDSLMIHPLHPPHPHPPLLLPPLHHPLLLLHHRLHPHCHHHSGHSVRNIKENKEVITLK